MEEKIKYYKRSIRIPCDSECCWGHIYLAGKSLDVSFLYLKKSNFQFNSDKNAKYNLEEITQQGFEKIKKEDLSN